MSGPDLSRLLRPKSIAVLGGHWAEQVVYQCNKMGFGGDIWPVHPKRAEMSGVACLPSLEDLPSAPDATFIAVNRHAALETIEALKEMGAGGGVCFASGFAEVGDKGAALQRRFVESAGDMPVLGPNCYGLINYLDGALLWPDQHGGMRRDRGVAILSQSGNIGINLTMNRRAVPIAYLGALGNQAQTGLAELTTSLAQDKRVTAIGIYVEGLSDAPAFADAVAVARSHDVPVVVLKAGRSAKGAEIAMSHTGSLAGSDVVMDAFFSRIGAVSVGSVPMLLEALKILHVHGRLPGKTIVTMSCSGGEALLTSDIAERTALDFRSLGPEEKERIKTTTHDLVTVDNPFDYHTFDWGAPERLERTYREVLACGFDIAGLIMDYPRDDRCDMIDWTQATDALRHAAHDSGARAAVIATLPELLPEEIAETLLADGIVPLFGLDDALHAIDACSVPLSNAPVPGFAGLERARDVAVENRSEWEAKQHIAAHGLKIPDGRICNTRDDAIAVFDALGDRVAAKAVGRDLLHKTEIGAVKLDLVSRTEVATAYDALAPMGEAVLIEAMAPAAVGELIVGVRRDPIVGLYVLIGSGGVAAELVRDTCLMLLPATDAMIRDALASLALAPLLTGYRGRAVGDIESAVAAINAVQLAALACADTLEEMEINPLLVHTQGDGVTAVDALWRVRAPQRPTTS